jgi:hypothetical protein
MMNKEKNQRKKKIIKGRGGRKYDAATSARNNWKQSVTMNRIRQL